MTVLVTGASGFIGGHIAEALQQAGHRVRATYRRTTPPPHLVALREAGAQLLQADLTKPGAAATTVEGVETVVHAAARADYFGSLAWFQRDNVQVTASLLDAAARGGCGVFVQVSSIAVHGFGQHRNTTEEGPYYPLSDPYTTTKWQAEQLVLAANGPQLRTLALRPSNVYGPRDTTVTTRVMDTIKRGVLPLIDGGEHLTSLVYVTDVARAVIAALKLESTGGRAFNICHPELVTMAEVLQAGANLLRMRLRRLPLSPRLARFVAGLSEMVAWLPGIASPSLTRPLVEQLSHDFHFSADLASQALDVTPQVGWRDGVLRTLRTFFPEADLHW